MMKRILLALSASLWLANAIANTNILLRQNFETSTVPPSGWSIIDHDGDGKNWFLRTDGQTGNKLACSRSYENGALALHNVITTSAIDLRGYNFFL